MAAILTEKIYGKEKHPLKNKNLNNFPYHKHESKDIVSSSELSLIDALDYIKKEIIHDLFSEK